MSPLKLHLLLWFFALSFQNDERCFTFKNKCCTLVFLGFSFLQMLHLHLSLTLLAVQNGKWSEVYISMSCLYSSWKCCTKCCFWRALGKSYPRNLLIIDDPHLWTPWPHVRSITCNHSCIFLWLFIIVSPIPYTFDCILTNTLFP